jgi:hypothetical protein
MTLGGEFLDYSASKLRELASRIERCLEERLIRERVHPVSQRSGMRCWYKSAPGPHEQRISSRCPKPSECTTNCGGTQAEPTGRSSRCLP